MANLPPLYANCIEQFTTEIARKAWLWFADAHDPSAMKFKADIFATEVDALVLKLRPVLTASHRIHDATDEVMDDLLRFILTRHANWRIGGNVRPPYLGAA